MPRQRLEKRKDGRYVCRYEDKYFYGKTQLEACRKRDQYVEELHNGFSPESQAMTFKDYAATWLQTYRTDCNAKALAQYANMIDKVVEIFKNRRIRDIKATDIQKVYNTLAGYSQSYINKFAATLRGIFKAALQDGMIIRDPTVTPEPPKGTIGGHRNIEKWERKLVVDTCQEHPFGLAAMVMLYAGLRRGEALYIDIDRDVDFENKTITVRGALSFSEGNQPTITDGKTEAAQRTIPMSDVLVDALRGHHGLLVSRDSGEIMSQTAFKRRYDSYMSFLSEKHNGIMKRWYGRTNAQKKLAAEGKLPPWEDVKIRCHDFRVSFCTMCYEANVPMKTLQVWMGHSDVDMIMMVYTKLSAEKIESDASMLNEYSSHMLED